MCPRLPSNVVLPCLVYVCRCRYSGCIVSPVGKLTFAPPQWNANYRKIALSGAFLLEKFHFLHDLHCLSRYIMSGCSANIFYIRKYLVFFIFYKQLHYIMMTSFCANLVVNLNSGKIVIWCACIQFVTSWSTSRCGWYAFEHNLIIFYNNYKFFNLNKKPY